MLRVLELNYCFHQYEEDAQDPPLACHSVARLLILSVKLGISKLQNFMCSFAGRMRVSLPAGSRWTSSISKLVSGGSRNLSGDSHSRRRLQFQCAKFPPPLLQIALSGPCYVSILAQHNDQGHFYHCIILSSDVAVWSMVVMSRDQLHLMIRSVHAYVILFSDVAGLPLLCLDLSSTCY